MTLSQSVFVDNDQQEDNIDNFKCLARFKEDTTSAIWSGTIANVNKSDVHTWHKAMQSVTLDSLQDLVIMNSFSMRISQA